MKKALLYLLLLVTVPAFSQRVDYYKFDTATYVNEFVKALNKYRTSKGLGTVKLGEEKWAKMANHHSHYMAKKRNINHDYFGERVIEYNVNAHGENCGTTNISRISCEQDNEYTYERLAKATLSSWIKSHDHNWNMLRRDTKVVYLGTSIVMDIIPNGIMNDPEKWAYKQYVLSKIYCTLIMGDGTEINGFSRFNY